MDGVSNAVNTLDKKLQAAIKIYDKVRLKLHQEQDFVNWFHKHFFGFKHAYLKKGKPLDAQIEKFVTSITSASDGTEILNNGIDRLLDRIVEIKRKLWDITEKHTCFYESSLLDKQRNLQVYQIFSDHSVRLWEALQARAKTNPPLTEEEIESLEVPDFLWELNNLYPHSQSIMDEYNSDVFASRVEQLAVDFKECTKYYSKKRPRPEDSDVDDGDTYSEPVQYYGAPEEENCSQDVPSVKKTCSSETDDSADTTCDDNEDEHVESDNHLEDGYKNDSKQQSDLSDDDG